MSSGNKNNSLDSQQEEGLSSVPLAFALPEDKLRITGTGDILASGSGSASLDTRGRRQLPVGQEEEEEEEETGLVREVARTSIPEARPEARPTAGQAERIAAKGKGKVVEEDEIMGDGSVSAIPSSLSSAELAWIKDKYDIEDEVILRKPNFEEVACSRPLNSEEVCLYEHMFRWGMRLRVRPVERSAGFNYLVYILSSFGLSPGQLGANGFITILGFWAFLYLRLGNTIPHTMGPFDYFFELRYHSPSGRYYFLPRRARANIPELIDYMPILRRRNILVNFPKKHSGYPERFFFATFLSNPFISVWSEGGAKTLGFEGNLVEEDLEVLKACIRGMDFSVLELLDESKLASFGRMSCYLNLN